MRICIYGAGSIGGYLAASLARAGREVSIVARGAHLEAIRKNGLTLKEPDGTYTAKVAASDEPADLGEQDIVVVTTKTPALGDVAAKIGPLLGKDTPVVFAMNGVFWWYGDGFEPEGRKLDLSVLDPDGALRRAIDPSRAMGMVIYSPNEVIAPGVVENTSRKNRFVLGDPAGKGDRLTRVAAALGDAGYKLDIADDIRCEMWRKLVLNTSMGPLASLVMGRLCDVLGEPEVANISRRLLEESIAVAAAHGFELGVDVDARVDPKNASKHKPSMLQDLERGRPMEVESLAGIVREFGHQAGVPTPTLDIVIPLLRLRAKLAGCYRA